MIIQFLLLQQKDIYIDKPTKFANKVYNAETGLFYH